MGPSRAYTLEDYWAVELESPLRHEYMDGVIYAMAGGKPRHNEVAANVQYALRRGLEAGAGLSSPEGLQARGGVGESRPRHLLVACDNKCIGRTVGGTPCRPIGADQRLKVADGKYTYADVSVFCGKIEVAEAPPPDAATNPVLVIEVLSNATRKYDLGEKRELYQAVPSVEQIWLIEPEQTWVKVLRRGPDGWTEEIVEDPAAALAFHGASVLLAHVYVKTVT